MTSEKFVPFHAKDIPDLGGYVALVTGGNSGIGYEISLQLALHGARVYIAGRSLERLKTAMEQMKASCERSLDVHMLEMDQQSFTSVKDGADAFMKQESRLDLLINNAGIMAVPYKLTPDGFETQWQTNHLAHFLLTKTLLPLLKSTAASSGSKNRVRIVNLSADAAILPPAPKQLDFAGPNLEYETGALSGWKRYCHSKLANIIHARALNDRYSEKGITAYSVHPGVVNTNLQNAGQGLFSAFVKYACRWGLMPGMFSVADGATSTLFCATSDKAPVNGGKYFAPFGKEDKRAEKWTGDKEGVDRLWEESERMIKGARF